MPFAFITADGAIEYLSDSTTRREMQDSLGGFLGRLYSDDPESDDRLHGYCDDIFTFRDDLPDINDLASEMFGEEIRGGVVLVGRFVEDGARDEPLSEAQWRRVERAVRESSPGREQFRVPFVVRSNPSPRRIMSPADTGATGSMIAVSTPAADPNLVAQELQRASQVLQGLVGESIDAIQVNSLDAEEAPFLGQIVSKLSPMIGNLLEARIIKELDDEAGHGFTWERQDPGFPDAILLDEYGVSTEAGFEVKAWYVHSTELTGRFRESVNLLAPRNVNLLVIAWSMSHLVYGTPKILGVLTTPGVDVASARDNHYWNPPTYLTVEPGDTTLRTRNLQQSNVNGYRLQDKADEAAAYVIGQPGASAPPHSPEAQALATDLMARFPYRLDTNFAKIDRIDNAAIEKFKAQMLASQHAGRTVQAWTQIIRDLNSTGPKSDNAARILEAVYNSL
ncbi:hypothetical protein Lsed01_00851 [Demequina sediminis]|uniref:Restriction endonuclease n=1 Tax=Demequina sediminis TaxID=1930058 RepID=A0ABP9WF12_9MICO|nr:hypothetical protein [Demequina sediminis]BDZ62495.1 hypothetical protein GCM10025873_22860 [Demequina sediminis]